MNPSDKLNSSMIFTLEDDNASAPVYQTNNNDWEQTLNNMRNSRNRTPTDPTVELNEFIHQKNKPLLPLDKYANAVAEELSEIADLRSSRKHHYVEPKATEPKPEPKIHAPTFPQHQNQVLDKLEKSESSPIPQASGENLADWAELIAIKTPPKSASQPAKSTTTTRVFGDKELDFAYKEYLKQQELQHNQLVDESDNTPEEDIGILIQEDWLAAQQALKSDRSRRYQTKVETLVLNEQKAEEIQSEVMPDGEIVVQETPKPEPEIVVHVYALPELPSTRKIKILSEKELMQTIQEKLRPHLSNAVAGMVRQALQKKMANLSYDLQMMLNEETPNMVEDVLEHNMAAIMRSIKEKL